MQDSPATAPEPAGFVLLPTVLNLARQLRQTGIPVSTSELVDAQQAVQAIDVLGRNEVRLALAATMVKRTEDLPAFNLLFDIHFRLRQRSGGEATSDAGRPAAPRPEIHTSLDRTSAGQGDESGATAFFELIMAP